MGTNKTRTLSIISFCIFMIAAGFVVFDTSKAAPARPAAMAAPRPATSMPAAMETPAAPRPVTMAPTAMEPATMAPTMAAASADQPAAKKDEKKSNEDSTWKVIIGGIFQILLLFVGAIATTCGPYLIKWIASKAKIQKQQTIDNMNAMYTKAVEFGVNYATQQSNKLNNNPEAKAKRIKWATDKATDMIKEFDLPEKTAGWIEDAIEAKIGEKNGKKVVKPEELKAQEPKEEKKKSE